MWHEVGVFGFRAARSVGWFRSIAGDGVEAAVYQFSDFRQGMHKTNADMYNMIIQA